MSAWDDTRASAFPLKARPLCFLRPACFSLRTRLALNTSCGRLPFGARAAGGAHSGRAFGVGLGRTFGVGADRSACIATPPARWIRTLLRTKTFFWQAGLAHYLVTWHALQRHRHRRRACPPAHRQQVTHRAPRRTVRTHTVCCISRGACASSTRPALKRRRQRARRTPACMPLPPPPPPPPPQSPCPARPCPPCPL